MNVVVSHFANLFIRPPGGHFFSPRRGELSRRLDRNRSIFSLLHVAADRTDQTDPSAKEREASVAFLPRLDDPASGGKVNMVKLLSLSIASPLIYLEFVLRTSLTVYISPIAIGIKGADPFNLANDWRLTNCR